MKKQILKTLLITGLFFFTKAYSQYTVVVNTSTTTARTICSNTLVTLFASTDYTGAVVGYTWTGSTFSIPIFQSSVSVGSGTYTVVGSTTDGALLGPQSIVVGPCVGVHDYENDSWSINVFPNPIKGALHFGMEKSGNHRCSLKLTTSLGQVVYSAIDFDLNNGLSLESTEAGVFYLTLQMNGLQKTFKVVKE